jgi:hypothetical protein
MQNWKIFFGNKGKKCENKTAKAGIVGYNDSDLFIALILRHIL